MSSTNKSHHAAVSKIKSTMRRLNRRLKKKYQKFRQDKRAWASFQKGYKMSVLYLLIVRPVQAIDTLEQLLEKARELQNSTDTTPAKAVGRLAALKNWF